MSFQCEYNITALLRARRKTPKAPAIMHCSGNDSQCLFKGRIEKEKKNTEMNSILVKEFGTRLVIRLFAPQGLTNQDLN